MIAYYKIFLDTQDPSVIALVKVIPSDSRYFWIDGKTMQPFRGTVEALTDGSGLKIVQEGCKPRFYDYEIVEATDFYAAVQQF